MRRGIRFVIALGCMPWLVHAACPNAVVADGIHAIAERVLASTVSVSASFEGGSHEGTGVLVSPVGHVLTASGVVPSEATAVTIRIMGRGPLPAQVVAVEERLGVAIVKVEAPGPFPAMPLGDRLPSVGDVAYTAGDVDDVMLSSGRASFSHGVVSGTYAVTADREQGFSGVVVETTAAVNRGSEGGPLVDAAGRVCGVLIAVIAPQRWQGVAVPTATLLAEWSALGSETVPVTIDTAPLPPPAESVIGIRRAAESVAPSLVGIEVERTWPPEQLPRRSWPAWRSAIAGWDQLSAADRRRQFAAFEARERMLDVNQLLRRPAAPSTGVVISNDGFIITSAFNVGDDTVFLTGSTGQLRRFSDHEPIEKLLADPEGGVQPKANAIRRVRVVLPDGTRHDAVVHARHGPLGVALLKLTSPPSTPLSPLDLDAVASSPQLGDSVAAVGLVAAGQPAITLNPGIVSAASRSRGYQFQTDALFNYGNSGGPVVDAAGNLLGIVTAPIEPDTVLGRIFPPPQLMRWSRAPNSGVGLVARADRLRAVLEDLRAGKSFERFPGPYLGVLADESRALGDDVVIGGVAQGSPAAKAGLRKGDIVLTYDGVELTAWREFSERIAAASPGDTVALTIRRRSSGPRLVIAGRDIETKADLDAFTKSLSPGDTFEGRYVSDDVREIEVVLGEAR